MENENSGALLDCQKAENELRSILETTHSQDERLRDTSHEEVKQFSQEAKSQDSYDEGGKDFCPNPFGTKV